MSRIEFAGRLHQIWRLLPSNFSFAVYRLAINTVTYLNLPRYRQIYRLLLNPLHVLRDAFLHHYCAKKLGGAGKFGRYAYLIAAIDTPLTILRQVILLLHLTPFLAATYLTNIPQYDIFTVSSLTYSPISFTVRMGVGLYWIVLAYFATRAEHGLTGWRVSAATLAAVLLSLVIRNTLFLALMSLTPVR